MRTAIIIRGQARTWNYLKQNTFKVFSEIYDNIDWYVVIENNGTVSHESIREDFKNYNLINCNLIDRDSYPLKFRNIPQNHWYKVGFINQCYWKPAWYDYIGQLAKREYELTNNFTYDHIISIRPDILYYLKESLKPLAKQKTYEKFEWAYNIGSTNNRPCCGFEFMQGGSYAADIVSQRFLEFTLNHYVTNVDYEMYVQYCNKNHLYPTKAFEFIHWEGLIVRPWNIDSLPSQQEMETIGLDKLSINTNRERLDLSNEEKYKICLDKGISIYDYNQNQYWALNKS